MTGEPCLLEKVRCLDLCSWRARCHDLSDTESRIANRTIPKIAAWNRQKLRSENQKNESNRMRSNWIAENWFRIAIRIASYQCLKRPWNRTILNHLIREWPRHCRKVYWTKMVQNGHFGQNDLILNWILAFARPKWTKMAHLVHFGLKGSISVHLNQVRQPHSGHSWSTLDSESPIQCH